MDTWKGRTWNPKRVQWTYKKDVRGEHVRVMWISPESRKQKESRNSSWGSKASPPSETQPTNYKRETLDPWCVHQEKKQQDRHPFADAARFIFCLFLSVRTMWDMATRLVLHVGEQWTWSPKHICGMCVCMSFGMSSSYVVGICSCLGLWQPQVVRAVCGWTPQDQEAHQQKNKKKKTLKLHESESYNPQYHL